MTLVRIDNRLIHGQIIETWIPYTGAKIVIVADDALAADDLQQEIMSLAIPQTVESIFVSIEGLAAEVEKIGSANSSSKIGRASCRERVVRAG